MAGTQRYAFRVHADTQPGEKVLLRYTLLGQNPITLNLEQELTAGFWFSPEVKVREGQVVSYKYLIHPEHGPDKSEASLRKLLPKQTGNRLEMIDDGQFHAGRTSGHLRAGAFATPTAPATAAPGAGGAGVAPIRSSCKSATPDATVPAIEALGALTSAGAGATACALAAAPCKPAEELLSALESRLRAEINGLEARMNAKFESIQSESECMTKRSVEERLSDIKRHMADFLGNLEALGQAQKISHQHFQEEVNKLQTCVCQANSTAERVEHAFNTLGRHQSELEACRGQHAEVSQKLQSQVEAAERLYQEVQAVQEQQKHDKEWQEQQVSQLWSATENQQALELKARDGFTILKGQLRDLQEADAQTQRTLSQLREQHTKMARELPSQCQAALAAAGVPEQVWALQEQLKCDKDELRRCEDGVGQLQRMAKALEERTSKVQLDLLQWKQQGSDTEQLGRLRREVKTLRNELDDVREQLPLPPSTSAEAGAVVAKLESPSVSTAVVLAPPQEAPVLRKSEHLGQDQPQRPPISIPVSAASVERSSSGTRPRKPAAAPPQRPSATSSEGPLDSSFSFGGHPADEESQRITKEVEKDILASLARGDDSQAKERLVKKLKLKLHPDKGGTGDAFKWFEDWKAKYLQWFLGNGSVQWQQEEGQFQTQLKPRCQFQTRLKPK